MALPVKMASYFGVLEYRSIGVLENFKAQIPTEICPYHYSITPPLHYPSGIPHQGKTLKAPSGDRAKPSPPGLDFLL
jgi:hypothetical protein